MTEIVLAFGSNLGNRVEQIQRAINEVVNAGLSCHAVSSCYESKAVGLKDQPDFINAVGSFACTDCTPFEVLRLISRIEEEMGRIRTVEKGPRNIDIDLIFFGKSIISTFNLTIPHQAYSSRRFVLEPLCELIPDFLPPGMGGRSLAALLRECPDADSSPVRMEKESLIIPE